MPRTSFRFIDLVVTIVLTPFLVMLLAVCVGTRAREASTRVRCGSNLSQIGKALMLYNSDFPHPPRTIYVPDAPLASFTAPAAADPFKVGGPSANDVTAAIYLLIRTQDITPELFSCPSANNVNTAELRLNTEAWSNFLSRATLSYAWINPYPSPAAVAAGYDYDTVAGPAADSEVAVAADIGPGLVSALSVSERSPSSQMKVSNSPNHQQDGQNVLYADGHVSFESSPFVGRDRDNIYASRVGTFDPAGPSDTVLLPTALDGPPAPPLMFRSTDTTRFVVGGIIAVVGFTVVIGVTVWRVRRRRATSCS